MARDFDGVDDELDVGSDTSIDDFAQRTFSCWIVPDVISTNPVIYEKVGTGPQGCRMTLLSTGALRLDFTWTGANGEWDTTNNALTTGTRYHITYTYDNGATTNDPVFVVNGNTATITENGTPTLVADTEAAYNLQFGLDFSSTGDFDGRLQNIVYHNTIMTAAEINTARWWGRPFGGLKVYHPLWTNKLTNEGSATADITAAGTTVVGIVTPVVRPGAAMMGMGIGW